MDHEELPPPTMRSPISTLRVRDHVVAVEVKQPRLARIRPRLQSGLYPVGRIPREEPSEHEVPTRRLGAA